MPTASGTCTGLRWTRSGGMSRRPSIDVLPRFPCSLFHTTVATRASDKTMKIQDPFAQNEKLGRPMSPHLTIYSWQLTNTMSILNRATAGAIGLGWSFIANQPSFTVLTVSLQFSTTTLRCTRSRPVPWAVPLPSLPLLRSLSSFSPARPSWRPLSGTTSGPVSGTT